MARNAVRSQAGDQNALLAQLPAAARDHLAPMLSTVYLRRKQVLQVADDAILSIYFPTTALLALVSTLPDGRTTGLGTIGRWGMAGIPALLGASSSPFEMVVQIAGMAEVLRIALFRDEVGLQGPLDRLLLIYTQAFLNQVSQTLACNSHHPVRGRMAVWLLRMCDGLQRDEFPVTHEFLALMLGTSRPTVTLAAEELARAGLIHYRRGLVSIVDKPRLEAAACVCYHLIRAEGDRLMALTGASETWRRVRSLGSPRLDHGTTPRIVQADVRAGQAQKADKHVQKAVGDFGLLGPLPQCGQGQDRRHVAEMPLEGRDRFAVARHHIGFLVLIQTASSSGRGALLCSLTQLVQELFRRHEERIYVEQATHRNRGMDAQNVEDDAAIERAEFVQAHHCATRAECLLGRVVLGAPSTAGPSAARQAL